MKKPSYLFILLMLALIFPFVSNAQGDVVDFGDSGIEVVVEADGKGDGIDTGWAYWFPDEFYDYFPFPTLPTLPFPGWGGGWGGGDDGDADDCFDAQNELLQIYEAILSYETSIRQAENDGFMWVGDKRVEAGSEEYEYILQQMKNRLRQLDKDLNNARKKIEDAC